MPTDENIYRVVVSRAPVVTGAEPAAPEWDDLQQRVGDLESDTVAVADLADVDLTGLADGDLIAYDETRGVWQRVPVVRGIDRVYDTYSQDRTAILEIGLGAGLRIYSQSPATGLVVVQPVFGSSGTDNVMARDDHEHPIAVPDTMTFGASGSLSSGTRTLTSGMITGLDPDIRYTVAGEVTYDIQGEGAGAGYSTTRLTIGGNGVERPQQRSVAGVPREVSLHHPGVHVSGVSSVAVNATVQYAAGDPVYINGGRLTLTLRSWR